VVQTTMVNGQVAIKSYNILHVKFLSTNNCFINTLQLFYYVLRVETSVYNDQAG